MREKFETRVQRALLERLRTDERLLSTVTGIHDDVPQDSPGRAEHFPYIVLGDDVISAWDTDTEVGVDASCTIHVWSRHRGRAEVKKVQGLIYDRLHRASFVADGVIFVTINHEQSQSFMDMDGLTRHGVQEFRVLAQEE